MNVLFLDTNIPMYAAGTASPYKEPCLGLLKAVTEGRLDAVTNVEVFQEILYRFHALKRLMEGIELSVLFRQCVPNALPVIWDDIDMAIKLLHQYKGLSPRDALHAGVMLNHGITQICSADKDFDRIKEIDRIDPLMLKL